MKIEKHECPKSAFENLGVDSKLKVGLVGYLAEGGLNFSKFAEKLTWLIEDATRTGAKLVMLPELLIQDLVDHSLGEDSFGPQMKELARHWPSLLGLITRLAQELKVVIYSGTFARNINAQTRNSGALVFPDGFHLIQDKLYMTPFEKDWKFSPGNTLHVLETPFGNWVNLICYDCEIPEISHHLVALKPTLLFIPSMTGATQGRQRVRWTAQARAIEHKAFVLQAVMARGQEPWLNTGQCAVLGPWDDLFQGVLTEAYLNEPGLLTFEIDFAKLKTSRELASVYPGRDQLERTLT